MKGYEILQQRLPRHIQIEWVKEAVKQRGKNGTIEYLDQHFDIIYFVHTGGFEWDESKQGYKYWDNICNEYFQ